VCEEADLEAEKPRPLRGLQGRLAGPGVCGLAGTRSGGRPVSVSGLRRRKKGAFVGVGKESRLRLAKSGFSSRN